MSYKHLSIEERNCIGYGIKNNKSITEISKLLGVSKSTVSREIKRNSENNKYNPSKAEKLSRKRKKNCGIKTKLTDGLKIKLEKLIQKKNSPEQIAGRMKKEGSKERISTKTIYNWISKGLIKNISMQNLRRKGKQRLCKDGRGKIGGKNISERPLKVETRHEV